MSETLRQIRDLVARRDVRISSHCYDELANDNLMVNEMRDVVSDAVIVEDYPHYAKGPCILVLQRGAEGQQIHVVWGIARDKSSPAVLVTAYRPNADRWSDDYFRRRP